MVKQATRRNFFVSYHHRSNFQFLMDLRGTLQDSHMRDYGFRDLDLSESSKYGISRQIQHRIWSSSVTLVLVGEKTGGSDWVDWEIWYSLQKVKASGPARRVSNPKGLVALFLPVGQHHVPKRLLENLDSGYAVRLDWKDIAERFYPSLEQAYKNRTSFHLIRNIQKPKINPQGLLGRIIEWF
ncbi:TIR domain-containing protein [Algoriphagus sp. H41]|uniref:TIR domain-containing protein n=1 Tax=Algoriphagus oliviformis TaxID=2811231 RepID=A0ABS3C8V2_9BACT|nr:TIR domain-containing protein [Algoriphagus oliviformis]MBN7813407.1 TIR domain-containing protein [Algoriphagus oliviformis]